MKLLGFGVPLAPLVVGKVLADAVEPTIKLADVVKLKESCEKHYDHSLDAERYTTWTNRGDGVTFSDPKNWSNGVPSGGEIMTFPPDVNVGRLA